MGRLRPRLEILVSKAPGYRKWPDHHITERHLGKRVSVELNGEIVADSDSVILVTEDNHPPRYYFPRDDIRLEKLAGTATTSVCPFKGTASYFSITAGGQALTDAAWSYAAPYEEHAELAGRVAFYVDKFPQLQIKGP